MSKKNRTNMIVRKRVVKAEESNPASVIIDQFKGGSLLDGNGRMVTDRATAIALALQGSGISYKGLEKAEMLNKIKVMRSMTERLYQKEAEKDRSIESKVLSFFRERKSVTSLDLAELTKRLDLLPNQINDILCRQLSNLIQRGPSDPLLDKASEIKKTLDDYIAKQEPIEQKEKEPAEDAQMEQLDDEEVSLVDAGLDEYSGPREGL